LKANKWGVSGVALFLVAILGLGFCQKFITNDRSGCFVPYIFLLLTSVACGTVATVRGSKWWGLLVLMSVILVAQGVLALLVE
jgi:hypothetical protein